MNSHWICITFLLAAGVLSNADRAPVKWPEDGNWYSDELEDLSTLDEDSQEYSEENLNNPVLEEKADKLEPVESDIDNDKKVEEEIERFENENLDKSNSDEDVNEEVDNIDDYQIEDNRSEVKEDSKKASDELAEDVDYDDNDSNLNDLKETNDKVVNSIEEKLRNIEDILEEADDIKPEYEDDIEDSFEEEFPKDINNISTEEDDEEKKILEETKALLMSDKDNDFADEKSFEEDKKENGDVENRVDEEKQNSQENKEVLKEDLDGEVEDDDISLEKDLNVSKEDKDDEEDSVDKAYKDLLQDLHKLDETWKKLNEDLDADDVDALGIEESKSAEAEAIEEEDDYDVIEDKNLHEIFVDHKDEDQSDDVELEEEEEDESQELPNEDSVQEDAIKTTSSKQIEYVNDAVLANDTDEEKPTATVEVTTQTAATPKIHKVEPLEENVQLNSEEFNKAIESFINIHSDDLHADASSDAKTVEPIRIKLSVDEPVVLTSPNYPNPYPTNAIIDWILEGEGMGIEFNVTDFAVNGNIGDYVLVKPGGVDASGNDGLVFSYMLRSERRYRFTNVNRMFIRFDAKLGMMWQRGFSFSIKMIAPLPEERNAEEETMPIPYPQWTLTLNLGGLSLEEFRKVEEDFRKIVADMATMYINANNIDPGRNTTSEVTQITSTALCYHNWPQFEECAVVRFGVPLQYDDEQERLTEEELVDMWNTYSQVDPFAARLRRLGITEFQIPNDGNVLMIWLVIGTGVIISMAMLAFALWRYSCFEDYTRMPTFGDSDSLNEKKTLDLYPTPHQTLPPLYSETDYKWADPQYEDSTRVDIGGFANRSYVRSEPYDLDSDEDVVPARDRYTTDV